MATAATELPHNVLEASSRAPERPLNPLATPSDAPPVHSSHPLQACESTLSMAIEVKTNRYKALDGKEVVPFSISTDRSASALL